MAGCYISSKANYPIRLTYGDSDVIIAPCAKRLYFEDASKFTREFPPKITKIDE